MVNSKKMVPFSASYGCPPAAKKKKKRTRRGKRSRGGALSKSCRDKLCAAICAQLDPFCDNCLQGIYDSNSARVIRMNLKQLFTVTTNANGHAAGLFRPSWHEAYSEASSIGGGGIVTAWGAAERLPFYDTNQFSHYRVISWGYRFISSVAPTNSQGFVQGATSDTTELIDADTLSIYRNSDMTRMYQADFSYVSRAKGKESLEFTPLGEEADGWEYAYLAISGAAVSTDVGVVEIVMNVEALPIIRSSQGTNVLSLLSAEAKPSVPQVLDLASNVQSKTQPFTDSTREGKDVSSSIMTVVEDVVAQGITTYGPQVLEAVASMFL